MGLFPLLLTRLANTEFVLGCLVRMCGDTDTRAHLTSQPEFIARKLCAELVVVPLHFSRYMELSRTVMDIFRRYDPDMCAAGCDEGYLK